MVATNLKAISAPLTAASAAADTKLADNDAFIGQFTLVHVRHNSGSMACMTLVEFWTVLRLRHTDRYKAGSMFLRFVNVHRLLVDATDVEVKAAINDTVPDPDLMTELCVQAIFEKVLSFLCPMGLLYMDFPTLQPCTL